MNCSKLASGVIFGSIGIAIGHAFACLPVAIHEAYEVGKVDDWFKAWIFFVFVLGLPALVLIEMPIALCVYLVCFKIKVCNISGFLMRLYSVVILFVLVHSFVISQKSSILVGLVNSLSELIFFAAIIETARFCMKVCRPQNVSCPSL